MGVGGRQNEVFISQVCGKLGRNNFVIVANTPLEQIQNIVFAVLNIKVSHT